MEDTTLFVAEHRYSNNMLPHFCPRLLLFCPNSRYYVENFTCSIFTDYDCKLDRPGEGGGEIRNYLNQFSTHAFWDTYCALMAELWVESMLALTIFLFFFNCIFNISLCDWLGANELVRWFIFPINDVITVACACEGYREVLSHRLVLVLLICGVQTGLVVCGAVWADAFLSR